MRIATHNGTITVKSTASGDHRTFKLSTQAEDAKFAPGERVLALLSGSDNTGDYRPFAFVKTEEARTIEGEVNVVRCRVFVWKKYRGGQFDKYAKMLERLDRLEAAGKVEINFEGRCRRCNRTLTTPESVALGIGPVCSGRDG